MSYSFLSANSQYLNFTNPLSNVPFTISAWIYPQATGGFSVGLYQNAGINNRDRCFIGSSGSKLKAETVNEGVLATQSTTSNDFQRESWNHCAGVFASSSSRTAYLNNISATTNTSNNTVNNFQISTVNGILGSFSGTLFNTIGNANYAEVGIWNAALTAAEIASLAKGMTCDKVRPQNLVFYAPLVRDLIDQKGGLTLTNNNGATVANHPRIYP